MFEGIAANDSKDLILFLYQEMHKELNELDDNNEEFENFDSDQTDPEIEVFKCINNFQIKNKSIISDLFYFHQANITRCCNCGKTTYNFSMYNILIFPLEKTRLYKLTKENNFLNVNIFDCFECHTMDERNLPGNTMYCNSCKIESDYLMSNKISSLPEVFTIVLNRGNNLQFDVEFQISYIIEDLGRYMIKLNSNCNELNTRYELIGIVIHVGNSGLDGHFYTYCKSPVDRKWYSYNDSRVKYISDPIQEIKGIPYLLFYQKIH